ncbi:hypothetical protein [Acidilobus sp.]|uniref:hypothetical protein n=1 Tax=Acidilobus sp. TaxID=1872109 RepID=UPI003D013FDD
MLIGDVKDYGNDILSLAKSSPLQGNMKSYYVIAVKDKDGNIIDYREGGLRSLTAGFLWAVASLLAAYNYNFSFPNYPTLMNSNCGLNYPNGKYAIVLGSGTQAFSPTINSLYAPITGASMSVSYAYNITSSGVPQFIFYGEYNNSGSAINVSEFGLKLTITPCNTSSSSTYLLTYDTLSSPVSVPSGGSISVAIVVNLTG